MHRRPAALGAALAATALLAACGNNHTTGKATSGHAALFDPCTTIPASAIQQIGADPSSAEHNGGVTPGPGWKLCTWSGSWYFLTVWNTTHTVAETKGTTITRDFTKVDLPGRDAYSFRTSNYKPGFECNITYPFAGGSIQIEIANSDSETPPPEPPCPLVMRAAKILDPYLPH